jgi:hypothetical protein
LNENTALALEVLNKLMTADLNEADFDRLTANRRSAGSAARTQLDTHVRVDQNTLRKQEIDTLPALIAEINEYRKTQQERDEKIIDGEVA